MTLLQKPLKNCKKSHSTLIKPSKNTKKTLKKLLK
jgi:hypothetical protein